MSWPFSVEPILDSYLAVALIVGVLLVLLLVGPQFGSLSPRRKWTLVALRGVVILLLTLALLRPTKVHEVRSPRRPTLLLLFDISRSMQLPSGDGNRTRWEVQKDALTAAQKSLASLADTMDVRIFAYDKQLQPLEQQDGKFEIPKEPLGEQTDVGTPLAEALAAELGKRVAGVFVLGDGVQTAFDPRVESHEAGRRLRDDFGAPLITCAIGPSADVAQGKDIAVDRLDEQFTVFVKNELAVRALVRIRGYVQQDVPVQLQLERPNGQREVVASKTLRASEDGRQIEANFTFVPQEAGNFRLHVEALPRPGELVTKNNSLTAYLTVLEGGLRVLYLEGEKRFEQKFVRHAINASPDIELDDRIIDRRGRGRWPIDVGDTFTSDRYDAFLLGDLEAAALGPEQIAALAAAVERGKGLIVIGGLHSFGRGQYHKTALNDVLPIVIDPLEGSDFNRPDPDEFFLDGPLKAVPTEPHPITRLAAPDENQNAWLQLPALTWAYRFRGVKVAPGVRVLLEAKEQPILVSGEYGRGRVLAFGAPSTYLWPMHGEELEHKRFWRQIVLWLVRREEIDKSEVWVRLDQRRFQPGSRVEVAAGARAATGDVLTNSTLQAMIVFPDGRREPLLMTSQGKQFGGHLIAQQPGDYAIEITATQGGKTIGTARTEFMVFDRDIELSNPAADPNHFASLAAWTQEFGGRSIAPEQLADAIRQIGAVPPEYEVRQSRWRLAGTPGEAWLMLLAMVCVLGYEWYLRKKWGLV